VWLIGMLVAARLTVLAVLFIHPPDPTDPLSAKAA
jgi:hypothetical protein